MDEDLLAPEFFDQGGLPPGIPTATPQPVQPPQTGFQLPNAITGGGAVGQAQGFNDLFNTVRNLFPANEPFGREGQLPGIDPLAPPPDPGLQDIQAQGLPGRNQATQQQVQQPAQTGGPRTDRGFIPEGTPTFLHQFPGQEPRRLPQRFGTLFRGIKDPSEQLQRPESFLGARGLPRLDPGTFGRLSAGEQDAFIKLGQERGLDPRDIFKEIESGRPVQPRFSRITSAATRSR